MKMIDPGAIVRETDFALARDTAGLFERLQNQSQKLQSGQIFALDSKQRNEYVNLAKQYLDAAEKKRGEDKTALGVVVKNYKLNPDNVFGPAPKAEPVPGRSPNLPGVARTVEVDY
jgi:ABC-type enterochelin transport system substrate-binding protein